MIEKDMREVVRRLHAENSEALLELLEFDQVLGEFLGSLERLATATQELELAARQIGASEADASFKRVAGAQECAGRVNAGMTQFLGAFRELHKAVQAWRIADVHRSSSMPSSPEHA
jgi:hypothetical protein